MSASTKPARKIRTIRPVKAANLRSAVQAAAASAAYAGTYKPTPAKADWNKIVQAIGISAGYLRVPYAFGLTLLPVWTAAYKDAKKGHVPAKPIVIAKKAPAKAKAPKPAPKPTSVQSTLEAPGFAKTAIIEALAQLAAAVQALDC